MHVLGCHMVRKSQKKIKKNAKGKKKWGFLKTVRKKLKKNQILSVQIYQIPYI